MYYVFCQRREDELNGTDEKQIAEIAQLVEHHLAKVGVASSSLVFRSIKVCNSRNVKALRDFLSIDTGL